MKKTRFSVRQYNGLLTCVFLDVVSVEAICTDPPAAAFLSELKWEANVDKGADYRYFRF